MQLDAKRCPPRTLGCVPPTNLEGLAEWPHPSLAGAVQPSVILGEDLQWRWIVGDESGEDLVPDDMPVFGDWQSAVRWKIVFDHRAANALIKTAGELMRTAKAVKLMLDVMNRPVSAETERA